ncbi:MAG: hypothetical protein ABR923_01250 [Terracidiphilus sp.]
MTWTVHKPGFNATPEQLTDQITRFYQVHPESKNLLVIDVWQRVEGRAKPVKDKSAEAWQNPHWYLNGEWWMQVSERQQFGFVEGYLWCMKTQVSSTAESYPRSTNSYRQQIDGFIKANPRLANEAVADTLRRFRERVQTVAPK